MPPPDHPAEVREADEFNAWTALPVDSVDRNELPRYKEVVAGRALVSLSPNMRQWQVGDRVAIAVPQIDRTFSPIIERVDTVVGNNRTYTGRLLRDDVPHSFVITVGERNVFANLSTPAGQFELVGNTELAWLMPVANMDQHVDYTQPDYTIPETHDVP